MHVHLYSYIFVTTYILCNACIRDIPVWYNDYHIHSKFDGDFNLAVWQVYLHLPN